MDQHETEPEHVLHVCRLALNLFDSLADWHRLTSAERECLAIAAMLHDIGWSRTHPHGRAHHKMSAGMIREHPWTSFDPTRVEHIAVVARYHRKACPDPNHPEFARLNSIEQVTLSKLAALLRIADGLDRRHIQRVDRCSASWSTREIVIHSESATPDDLEPELEGAFKKADLLLQFIDHVAFTAISGTASVNR
jgi:exopolyphosphatase / guanosine-5'-triphosphate,3'-diphosphate pyrophosphatase